MLWLAATAARGDEVSPLVTRWSKEVTPATAWPEYPRPQRVRKDWLNLNGTWELCITDLADEQPTSFPDTILVPFPIESYLGGVRKSLAPSQRAWYRRKFIIDAGWEQQKLLLHFGAVDWHAKVWINGVRAGEHRGGYDPFTLDITDLVKPSADNVLIVGVSDPTDTGSQARGKQKSQPEGIWYTPTSGIWQTVWIEPVPATYVSSLRATPNLTNAQVVIDVQLEGAKPDTIVEATVKDGESVVASAKAAAGQSLVVDIDDVRPWSPDDPFLYDLDVRVIDSSRTVDQVTSYFGMRSIQLGTDRNGQTRILFNGKPLFQFGPLDQGFWPDGLYTAPTDEALRYDLEVIKRLGFNMVRKHVKVEPARWYYWCDKLGLLVWQDMPNSDQHAQWPADGVEIQRSEESAVQYRRELQALVDGVGAFTSVVVWVPFNEAWGQFDTVAITQWLEKYDPTRLVISASGGNDFGCGHINDDHFYPGPGAPPAERDRAAVLGEFGGLGLPLTGHTWQDEKNWGYRSFQTREELLAAYQELIVKLRQLVESHLSAAVYTQTTDVEIEVNGLMSYDRQVIKMDEDLFRSASESLYAPIPDKTPAERVAASVLAWWRFEEGDSGQPVANIADDANAIAARDASGHRNHLYAFSPNHAPATSSSVPRRQLSLGAVVNRFSLDDTAPPAERAHTRDLYTNPGLAHTHMDLVDRFPLTRWTIEASFCLSNIDGEQVVLAKEADRSGTKQPLFQLGVFGSPPSIGIEMLDEANENVSIESGIPVQTDRWWHVAVTCRDGFVRLYVADDDPKTGFRLVGQVPVAGGFTRREGTWLVGRGCESGKTGRDFLGWVDEVRISTKALEPPQFLFSN